MHKCLFDKYHAAAALMNLKSQDDIWDQLAKVYDYENAPTKKKPVDQRELSWQLLGAIEDYKKGAS